MQNLQVSINSSYPISFRADHEDIRCSYPQVRSLGKGHYEVQIYISANYRDEEHNVFKTNDTTLIDAINDFRNDPYDWAEDSSYEDTKQLFSTIFRQIKKQL